MQYSKREKIVLGLIYFLAIYILFQLCWWGFSLAKAHKHHIESVHALETDQWPLFKNKLYMIVGEGVVFLLIMSFGFWYVKRTVTRELRRARMEKTFLLSVTHELKTPIAAIKLFLETMKSRKLDESQLTRMVEDALRETDRLQNLSENILLATRFDHQRTDLFNEEVSIPHLIGHLVQRFAKYSNRSIRLDCPDTCIVYGDRELLRALFFNLIENAIKYSSEGQEVSIQVAESTHEIRCEIRDHGPGILPAEKERIFEKFYRSGDESTRKHKGTGLGLYIANSVAKLHKASLQVLDNKPTGSIFAVSFNKVK